MMNAERAIRNALAEPAPATRSQLLLREYRLSSPEQRHALVMGMIARLSIGPAAPNARSEISAL